MQSSQSRDIPIHPNANPRQTAYFFGMTPDVKPSQRLRTKKGSPVVSFLNTSLGLWLLSTIFISAGSAVYASWSAWQTAERKRLEVVRRLDTEISFRLRQFGLIEKDLILPPPGLEPETELKPEVAAPFLQKVIGPPEKNQAIFKDYESRGLISLLAELASNLKGKDGRCVEIALHEAELLVMRSKGEGAGISTSLIRQKLGVVDSHRWGFGNSLFGSFMAMPSTTREKILGAPDTRKLDEYCGSVHVGKQWLEHPTPPYLER